MAKKENDETVSGANPARSGTAGIATVVSLNSEPPKRTGSRSTAKNTERHPNMFATVNNIMDHYGVSRKIAVMVYRYTEGIDTVADVVMALVRKNPISGECEASMAEWMYFCEVLQAEGFEVGQPERKIEKDYGKFVFAS